MRTRARALLVLAEIDRKRAEQPAIWTPLDGPQTQARDTQADVLFYGGAAGGGKTDLILGLAFLSHHRSIIFRREYPQLQGIIDRGREIIAPLVKQRAAGYVASPNPKFWLAGGKVVELGAVANKGDEEKYQGRPHDLKAFDEITHFTEAQFRFLTGWTRTTDAKQRKRVVCAGNPPTTPDGDWVVRYFAPWLDESHPHPAKPGELRWFTTIDGVDQEVPTGEPFELNGEIIQPESRTFIPARVEDNPYLMRAGYRSKLQALPEPLRSKMLYGSFKAGREDDPYQVIPTEWIRLAQQRWRERARPTTPMTALGVDVARGGKDRTAICARYDNWFREPWVYPGNTTPDGPAVAALVIQHRTDNAAINVDVIGVGSSVYDTLRGQPGDLPVLPMNSSEGSQKRDKSGQLGFVNQRAEWWWSLREALDPASGEDLAIPDDRELAVDLCAPRWELRARGIQIEDKESIIERIGRSPDKGESLVYAHAIKFIPGTGLLDYYAVEAARVAAERAEAARAAA